VECILYGHRGALTVTIVASVKAARLREFDGREGMTKGDSAVSTHVSMLQAYPRGFPQPILTTRPPPCIIDRLRLVHHVTTVPLVNGAVRALTKKGIGFVVDADTLVDEASKFLAPSRCTSCKSVAGINDFCPV
jgi:hypothetical protein